MSLHPGARVECQTVSGRWVPKRAVSRVVRGGSMLVVMVMGEDEWVAAGRPVSCAPTYREVWATAPESYGWPADYVRANRSDND